MNIKVICSDIKHPILPILEKWVLQLSKAHDIQLVTSKSQLSGGGDILFLVSCHDIIDKSVRDLFSKTLVIHASDLPSGRGWSPLVWQILEKKTKITVTMLEAEDAVDSGDIWQKNVITVEPHETFDQINTKLFNAEIELMDFAVENLHSIEPQKQGEEEASYYRKRTPKDSEIDIHKTIEEQFDLLRVCDPERYPAFFEHLGHKYKISIEKLES